MKRVLSTFVASAVFVAVYLSFSPLSYAFPPGEKLGHHPGFVNKVAKEVLEQLDLTEEQKQELRELDKKTKEKMSELRKKMREVMRTLREEMEKYDGNENIIKEKVAEAKKIGGEILDLKINNFLQLKKVLTKEQFEEFIKNLKIQMRIMMKRKFKNRNIPDF